MVNSTVILFSFLAFAVATSAVSDVEKPDEKVCEGGTCADTASWLQQKQVLASPQARLATQHSRSFSPDETKTKDAFSAAADYTSSSSTKKQAISDKWSAITNAVSEAGIVDAAEYAMFFANVMQESDQLQAKKEYNPSNDAYDWSGSNHYYGRGYLMLTWKSNYQKAKAVCNRDSSGNTVDIEANPSLVETDETLAWCTAAWFWLENVNKDRCNTNGDSTHDCDMGGTIDAINGDLECENNSSRRRRDKKHSAEAKRRFCFYKKFTESYSSTTLYWADSVCMSGLDGDCPTR